MEIIPKVLRVAQFCEIYATSKPTFYRQVAAGKLQIIKRGRTTLISIVEAERWFAALSD